MVKEIEKKFLVTDLAWQNQAEGVFYRQGYLSTDPERTVRIRTMGKQAVMTIKGITTGISRSEFEYTIPLADANRILDEICHKPLIQKNRYTIDFQGQEFVVDMFLAENNGLIIAEVELENEDQNITLPEWIGQEVSHDPKYFNANLVKYPYCDWTANEK